MDALIRASAEQSARARPRDGSEQILAVVQDLSLQHDVRGVHEVVRSTARELLGCDGVTLVLREDDLVYYAEENAIAPLWRGRRFPATACISGWAILNRESVVIEDIYADARIPLDAYRATFVKSLAMAPIRVADPIGAIGAYWADHHRASDREVMILEALAASTAIALANAELYSETARAVHARDEFIGIASHELRTPLTPLLLQLDGLGRALDRGADPATFRAAFQKMRANLQRMAQLVDKLLSLSAFTQGRIELSTQDMDLVELTRTIVEGFESERLRSGSSITVRGRAAVWIQGDRLRLEQVATNLISNAIKYGKGEPIEITIDETDRRVRFVVLDHGIGIAPHDQARVFERFERAASARHYGGFGVGLWLVRQIVEAHEGAVSVTSRPGEGSTFTVLLPRAVREGACNGSS